MENKFQKHFNFGHSKDSSSDEDSDDPDLPNYNKQTQKSKEILEAKPNGDSFKKRPHSETNSNIANKDFLPNFDEDKEIKDALSYFCCVKELDELRKDWSSNRVKLVEVCSFFIFGLLKRVSFYIHYSGKSPANKLKDRFNQNFVLFYNIYILTMKNILFLIIK